MLCGLEMDLSAFRPKGPANESHRYSKGQSRRNALRINSLGCSRKWLFGNPGNTQFYAEVTSISRNFRPIIPRNSVWVSTKLQFIFSLKCKIKKKQFFIELYTWASTSVHYVYIYTNIVVRNFGSADVHMCLSALRLNRQFNGVLWPGGCNLKEITSNHRNQTISRKGANIISRRPSHGHLARRCCPQAFLRIFSEVT
jgi:hypothetical protein